MRRRRLKPWVKMTLTFIMGVIVVSQIFKMIGASADTPKKNNNGNEIVIHALIELNVNGHSVLKPIDSDRTILEVNTKEDYLPCNMVTVIMKNGEIVEDYLTSGIEEKKMENNYGDIISVYRHQILGGNNN